MDATERPAKRRRILVDVLGVIRDPGVRAAVDKIVQDVQRRLREGDEKTVLKYLEAGAGALTAPEAGPISEPAGERTPGGRIAGFPRAELNRVLAEHTKDLTTAGTTFAGRWADVGYASGPAPKNPIRDLQLGNQLAQTLINAIAGKTAEIEAMIVNNRIIVSANEASTIAELSGKSLADLVRGAGEKRDAELLEDFQIRKTEKFADLVEALRGGPGIHRLADLVVDSEVWEEQAASVKAVLTTLQNAVRPGAAIEVHDVSTVAGMIEDPAHAGKIIAVAAQEQNGRPIAHAEQNLALALAKSGHREPVAISGGKRPCAMCAWSLELVRRRSAQQLRFNPHPGGYWHGTTGAGLYNIVSALQLNEEQFKAEFAQIAGEEITQYVTDFDTDADLLTKLDNLVEAVERRWYSTGTSTPSVSGSVASLPDLAEDPDLAAVDHESADPPSREANDHGSPESDGVSWDSSSDSAESRSVEEEADLAAVDHELADPPPTGEADSSLDSGEVSGAGSSDSAERESHSVEEEEPRKPREERIRERR